jgi:hypothetical protein
MEKLIVLLILSIFVFVACSTTSLITIDGEVDTVEQALIDTSVAAALALYPDGVQAAYDVSTEMMTYLDDESTIESVTLSVLDSEISELIEETELTDTQKAQATVLYAYAKTILMAKLEAADIVDLDTQLVAIEAIVESVQTQSAALLAAETE